MSIFIRIDVYFYSDTQTILTIQNHVITKNHRISILHSEHKTWQLKIKDIRESDRGFYMCQVCNKTGKIQFSIWTKLKSLKIIFTSNFIDEH